MTKQEMTIKIKKYINKHPEMQKDIVLYTDILKAEKELNIHKFYIMFVQRYGKIY